MIDLLGTLVWTLAEMIAPEFAKAAAQGAGEAVFVEVNTDDEPHIASHFRIQGIPAFALIKEGELAAQTSGFQPSARLLHRPTDCLKAQEAFVS